MATKGRPESHAGASSSAPRAAATVLVVEDELAIREMLGQVLADEGYRVLVAGDGEGGLDVLRRERVDLLLLDLMLPGVDGYGVLQALGKSTGLGSIPVIVITAASVRRERMRGCNVARVVRKPVALDALLQVVQDVLKRR